MEQTADDASEVDVVLAELMELEQGLRLLMRGSGDDRSERQPYVGIGEALQHLQAAQELLRAHHEAL